MKKPNRIYTVLIFILLIVFAISLVILFFGDYFDRTFNVIGIRITALFLSLASFGSSTLFSLLVYRHNKTVSSVNDDSNRRAELFRDLQFASSNYSIIEFTDRMLIIKESQRYIDRLSKGKHPSFHLVDNRNINPVATPESINDYNYFTIRIPFKVIEGKVVSSITIDELRFERDKKTYQFYPNHEEEEAQTFILNNEITKRSNMIINIAISKDSDFFNINEINIFSKIKLYINITSLLGVKVKGLIELYFTNPSYDKDDEYAKHSYKINSSYFKLLTAPSIIKYHTEDETN